jgi:hypothetical protein
MGYGGGVTALRRSSVMGDSSLRTPVAIKPHFVTVSNGAR